LLAAVFVGVVVGVALSMRDERIRAAQLERVK